MLLTKCQHKKIEKTFRRIWIPKKFSDRHLGHNVYFVTKKRNLHFNHSLIVTNFFFFSQNHPTHKFFLKIFAFFLLWLRCFKLLEDKHWKNNSKEERKKWLKQTSDSTRCFQTTWHLVHNHNMNSVWSEFGSTPTTNQTNQNLYENVGDSKIKKTDESRTIFCWKSFLK